ncbi:hypothetical protein HRED_09687, partial [Candidatus Haloredivivus sp. G17]
EVKQAVERSGQGAQLYNRDYTATQMFITLDEEMTEENIRDANQKIRENLEQTPKQPGVDITVTGNPVIMPNIKADRDVRPLITDRKSKTTTRNTPIIDSREVCPCVL